MKLSTAIIFTFILFAFTGCQVIGNIFGAGIYVGVFISVLFVALIIFVISKISKKD